MNGRPHGGSQAGLRCRHRERCTNVRTSAGALSVWSNNTSASEEHSEVGVARRVRRGVSSRADVRASTALPRHSSLSTGPLHGTPNCRPARTAAQPIAAGPARS